jgi:3-dehydroquinate dehydratase-2
VRILVVNGPNLNLLGTRRTDLYGSVTLPDLEERCRIWGRELGVEVETFQSNHEGAIVDRLHDAVGHVDGVVINPGALTHYSYSLHDAIEAVALPTVEVHITDVSAREPWRAISVVSPVCVATVSGRGIEGYRDALSHLAGAVPPPAAT